MLSLEQHPACRRTETPFRFPTQDMVLGLYYLTFHRDEYKGPAKAATRRRRALRAADGARHERAVGSQAGNGKAPRHAADVRRRRRSDAWRSRTG